MSEAAAPLPVSIARPTLPTLSIRVAWRNLWRNRRRTWLTAGGIAFAVLLVVFSMAMQLGQYDVMMDNATSLMTGHIQIQRADYVDSDRFEDTINDATQLRRLVAAAPDVQAVAPRVEAFALASSGERSFGAMVVGVDMEAEARTVRFLDFISAGQAPVAADDALLGEVLARNLGVGVGDEVVLLGSAKEGGVAALVLNVSGLFRTGQAEVDRSMLWTPIATVQEAFALGDEVHTLAVRTDNLAESAEITQALARQLARELPDSALVVRNWDDVMPEVRQAIEVDRLGGELFFYIIELLVVFSVVNTFIMTVFERTREFGMLLAIGMRPGGIVLLIQWEAFFIWLVGVAIGVGLAALLTFWLAQTGIYLGESMEELAEQMYMPSRMYPAFSVDAFVSAPLVMFFGTQLAALVSSVRVLRMRPVEALRVS